MSEQSSRITPAEFEALVRGMLPGDGTYACTVTSLSYGDALLRLEYDPKQLRPGGTISGPTMMTLADTALYAAVLSCIGMVPLAVTSDLAFRFLRRPEPKALVARSRILRLGKRNAVGTIEIASEGAERGVLVEPLVAHATGTYAIP